MILSVLGAVLLLLISIFPPLDAGSVYLTDRLIVGGAFIACCVFGISLAIKPGWIRRLSNKANHGAEITKGVKVKRSRRGHHPDCHGFQTHIINTKKKGFCAGCTGLAIGSVSSIIFTAYYIVFWVGIPWIILFLLILLGILLIVFNYMEVVNPYKKSFLHLISNVFLIIGFLLVVIGVFQSTGNIFIGISAVLISFLWLDTRIQLSSWRHTKICKTCKKTCKAY